MRSGTLRQNGMLKLTGEIIGYRLFVNIFNRTRRSVVDEVRYYETNE
jgi:hypothetical protein